MRKLINTKDWGHSIYNAYLDIAGNYSRLQDKATGVAAVCIDENEKVVLMSGEPIGGHIEKGEAVDDALKRESLEEGGIKLEKWKFFGYYEVMLKENAEQKYKDKYPKVGYILFFLAKGITVMDPYGADVKSPQTLDINIVLNSNNYPHEMLQEGLKLYSNFLD